MHAPPSTVRPAVTYGSETWRLTKRLERRLEVFENGVLRRICGAVFDQQELVWRRRHNEELRFMTQVPLITDVIRAQTLRCACHVARSDVDSAVRRAFDGIPDGKRPVGRPRKRWKYCVQEDARNLGLEKDWREAAQERKAYRMSWRWQRVFMAFGQHSEWESNSVFECWNTQTTFLCRNFAHSSWMGCHWATLESKSEPGKY